MSYNRAQDRYTPDLPLNRHYFTEYGYLRSVGVPADEIDLPKLGGRRREVVWMTKTGLPDSAPFLLGELAGRWYQDPRTGAFRRERRRYDVTDNSSPRPAEPRYKTSHLNPGRTERSI